MSQSSNICALIEIGSKSRGKPLTTVAPESIGNTKVPDTMRLMPTESLQSGLVGVLRLFAAFQVVKGFILLLLVSRVSDHLLPISFLPFATAIGFLIYVFSGVWRAKLGKWYLIVTVLLATVDSLLTKGEFWYWLATDRLLSNPVTKIAVLPNFVHWIAEDVFGTSSPVQPFSQMSMLVSLLLLLIVMSWQYDFRYAIGFTILTTVLDLLLNVLAPSPAMPQVFLGVVILVGRTGIFLIVGNLIAHLIGIQNRQRQSLLVANEKLARYASMVEELTISRERNRMARELHDTLAHTLSAATVQLEATHALWPSDSVKAHLALDRGLDTIRSGLTETRRALKALRATPLEDLGFGLALKELGEVTQQRSGAHVAVAMPLHMPPLAGEVEHAFFRVAQEALENIVRHAQAKHVQVSLTQQREKLAMVIEDDGAGFDVEQVQRDPNCYGLRGMTERIEALGGKMHIDSGPQSGTRISLEANTL